MWDDHDSPPGRGNERGGLRRAPRPHAAAPASTSRRTGGTLRGTASIPAGNGEPGCGLVGEFGRSSRAGRSGRSTLQKNGEQHRRISRAAPASSRIRRLGSRAFPPSPGGLDPGRNRLRLLPRRGCPRQLRRSGLPRCLLRVPRVDGSTEPAGANHHPSTAANAGRGLHHCPVAGCPPPDRARTGGSGAIGLPVGEGPGHRGTAGRLVVDVERDSLRQSVTSVWPSRRPDRPQLGCIACSVPTPVPAATSVEHSWPWPKMSDQNGATTWRGGQFDAALP